MKKTELACLLLLFITSTTALAQTRSYPKEIRGYKIERTAIEIKRPESKNAKPGKSQTNQSASDGNGQTEAQNVSDSDGTNHPWRQSRCCAPGPRKRH